MPTDLPQAEKRQLPSVASVNIAPGFYLSLMGHAFNVACYKKKG